LTVADSKLFATANEPGD